MPVHVKCPTCSTVLAAPSKTIGSVVSCPHCHHPLMVPGAAPAATTTAAAPATITAAGTATLNAAAPPAVLATMSTGTGTATAATFPVDRSQFFPPGMAEAAASPPPASPTAALPTTNSSSSPPANNLAAFPPGMAPPIMGAPPAAPVLATAPPVSLKQLVPPTRTPAAATSITPPPRQLQAAKFIAADATATKIDLAADGRLPTLRLEELKEEEQLAEKPTESNPLLLVGVLAFSIAASVAMLFIDPATSSRGSVTKADARRSIQEYYLPDRTRLEAGTVRLKPYQKRLRDALLAYNRGDFVEERQHYREVLDMLHSEDKNIALGITGDFESDQQLKSLISTLLSNN